ncbi:MAG: alkaline shock response membrane anchor protein AmaP [Verrucomicrobia bacterium]|nr:alkaline shock response membrane anchor protein AmaP [Verrucomicrobiota bacterium]
MHGHRRAPAIIAIVTSVFVVTCFVILALYMVLHDLVPFVPTVNLQPALDSVWSRIVGSVMFAVAVVLVVALIARVRRQDCISFDNPDGEVIIAITAIEEFIKRLGKSFTEVRDISPTVVAVDGGVAIEARVALWDDQNIHAACERIQKAIRGQVQQFFGLANVHTVKVFIAKTVSRGDQAARGAAAHGTPLDEYAEEHVEQPEDQRQDT